MTYEEQELIKSLFESIKKELQDDNISIDLSPILSFSIEEDTQLFEQAWNVVVNAMSKSWS